MATSSAADRVYVGSNPTPSSTDCALYAARMLVSLVSACGGGPDLPEVPAPPLDPASCAPEDPAAFGAIGMARELLDLASRGRCAEALLAAADVARYLAGAEGLPEGIRRWAEGLARAKYKGASRILGVGR